MTVAPRMAQRTTEPGLTERAAVTAGDARPIAVLNRLLEATLDTAYGYREAAGDARSPAVRGLFEDRWLHRKQLTANLQAEVRSLGGTPDEAGTLLTAAQRIFFNLRNTIAGSDQSIIDEVEAGEDRLRAQLERALASEELPLSAQDVVIRVHQSVRADHDQMRDLRRSLQTHPATATDPAELQNPSLSLVGS